MNQRFYKDMSLYWPPSKGSPGEKSRLNALRVSGNSKCQQNLNSEMKNGVLLTPFLVEHTPGSLSMCGVVGLIGEEKAGEKLYPALFALQHRGQDAAGILSYDFDRSQFHLEKDLGLVEDVFTTERQQRLKGSMAIGHTRYSTIGTVDKEDLQPLFLSYPYGMGMIHNGNVTNYDEVVDYLRNKKLRWTFSRNDLEILMHMTAAGLASRKELQNIPDNLAASIKELLEKVEAPTALLASLQSKAFSLSVTPTAFARWLLAERKR